jgi:hypothetical protein
LRIGGHYLICVWIVSQEYLLTTRLSIASIPANDQVLIILALEKPSSEANN